MTDVVYTLNQSTNQVTLIPDGSLNNTALQSQVNSNTTAITALQNLTSHGVVDTSQNQTVDGIKVYLKPPVVPTPVASNQAATKGYVDGLAGGFTQGSNGKWVLSRAPYNADFTGTTDATTVFQNALNDIRDAGGGELLLDPGILSVTGNVTAYSNTTLSGCGMSATTIKLANGSNKPVLKNFVSPDSTQANGQFIHFRDFKINGNKANNTGSSNNHGIVFTQNPLYAQTTNDIDFDPHNFIDNVQIYNCHSDGLHASGRSELRVFNVYAFKNDGHGIYGSFDTFVVSSTACWSGLNGFYSQDSSIRYVNCKAFYNGQISVDGTNGNGFALNNGQGGQSVVNCEAQDNAGIGFALNNCQRATLVNCVADSNSQPHINSSSALGSYAAFDLYNSVDNRIIGCISYERNAYGGSGQLNALKLVGSTRNKIDITHSAYTFGGATVGAPIMSSSSSVLGNDIDINVQKGTQSISFSSTITPDFYAGGTIIVGQLAGPVTIANPAYSHAGMRITLMFKQDSTGGRTVSWGNAYSPNGWTVTSTASTTSSATFVHDGATFQALR